MLLDDVVDSALNVLVFLAGMGLAPFAAMWAIANGCLQAKTGSGTAEANATVSVYLDAALIGTTTADGAGAWSFDYTGTTLAAGSYNVTATATDAAGNVSGLSAALPVLIDTTAPAAPVVNAISTDTGVAGDEITTDQTLIFSGTGNKALLFGGRKGAATPRRNAVPDTNTKQMAAATWTPRHMRSKR